MKIAIIGATGHAGSAIFKEALKRGHEVTVMFAIQIKVLESCHRMQI